MEPETKVIFRFWEGDVIAIFPEVCGDNNPYTCSSYQRIGQHGACTPNNIVANSRPAKPDEYASLKRELESEPYKYRLRVIQRLSRRFLDVRRKEISRPVPLQNPSA